jgi:hypothetical protein
MDRLSQDAFFQCWLDAVVQNQVYFGYAEDAC